MSQVASKLTIVLIIIILFPFISHSQPEGVVLPNFHNLHNDTFAEQARMNGIVDFLRSLDTNVNKKRKGKFPITPNGITAREEIKAKAAIEFEKGINALQLQKYDSAYSYFDGVLVRMAVFNDPVLKNDTRLGIASALFYLGEIEDCRDLLLKVEKLVEDFESLMIIGHLYSGLGKHKKSAGFFKRVLVLDPCNMEAIIQLKAIYSKHLRSKYWTNYLQEKHERCEKSNKYRN